MSRRRAVLPSLLLAAVLATACAGEAPPPGPDTTAVDGTGGAEMPIGDGPVPVEGDGGIGGPGGPPASNLILSADQVEVTGTCLVAEDPPTYRLDLAGGDVLTVATRDEGGSVQLQVDGVVHTSPDGEPPVINAAPGATSVQGRVVADDGAEHLVDAVVATTDLPPC